MMGSRAKTARLLGKTKLERKVVQNKSGEVYKAHLDNKIIYRRSQGSS